MSAHPTGHRSHIPKRGGAQRWAARHKDKYAAQAKRLERELKIAFKRAAALKALE